MYTVNSTLHIAHCKLHTATLQRAHCTLYTANFKLQTEYVKCITLYTALQTAHSEVSAFKELSLKFHVILLAGELVGINGLTY